MAVPSAFNLGNDADLFPVSADAAVGRPPVYLVPVESLSDGDSPRLCGQDSDHVKTLAQAERHLPPILVRRSTMRVIDGMHRLQAAKLRGDQEIEVCFFDGDETAAFIAAVQLNIAHGLPLTLTDRTAAATRILDLCPQWSDRGIALTVGLSAATVAALRRRSTIQSEQSNTRIGRDGRARPLDTASARTVASELIRKKPDASVREIARSAGISPSTVQDVRERLARGQDPVPPRQRVGARGTKRRDAAPQPSKRVIDHSTVMAARSSHEPTTLLERLRKDPSLRLSESGRTLLKVLAVCAMGTGKLSDAFDQVPPHCTATVVELVRTLAQQWDTFANELEDRSRLATEG